MQDLPPPVDDDRVDLATQPSVDELLRQIVDLSRDKNCPSARRLYLAARRSQYVQARLRLRGRRPQQRQRTKRASASPRRGSRRVATRSSGRTGDSGDPDEPEPPRGRLRTVLDVGPVTYLHDYLVARRIAREVFR